MSIRDALRMHGMPSDMEYNDLNYLYVCLSVEHCQTTPHLLTYDFL
jgi:hypothetical protein